MTDHIPIHPFPHDAVLEELASQLLECGAVLSQIISHMVRFGAEGHAHPDSAPIPAVARSLIADVLGDVRRKHSRRDMQVAAAIVGEATQAICDDIFMVDPSLMEAADGQPDDDDAAA